MKRLLLIGFTDRLRSLRVCGIADAIGISHAERDTERAD